MNRQQRRRQQPPKPIDLTQPHNADCATAALVAQLIRDRDQGWELEPGRCSVCGYATSANHVAANVWVCQLCGAHGHLDGDKAVMH